MPNNDDAADATADLPEVLPVVADYPVTLSEFCARLSQTDKRVELIGAFHSIETAAKRMRDTENHYATRFSEFINQPA